MFLLQPILMRQHDWSPDLQGGDVPLFEAIALAIAADITDGRLKPGDRLPTQRSLAKRINLDVTTIARGYAEAARTGLVEARVGAGTFVRSPTHLVDGSSRRTDLADRSMNQPPEVYDSELLGRMSASLKNIGNQLPQLLRYQPGGGVQQDKAAAVEWLSRRGILVDHHSLHITAGAHTAISAVLSTLLAHGGSIACESITYPGLRSIAANTRCELHGLPSDESGIDPSALADAAVKHQVRVLYQNPTLRNPTTETVSVKRRMEIVEVARKHGLAIIEDDAYGFLPVNPPPAIAMLAPELTFYVASLAKCMGPGLRLAYLLSPRTMEPDGIAESLRGVSVMASPLTTAIATSWIETGIADQILASIRSEMRLRRRYLTEAIPTEYVKSSEFCFHAWISAPPTLDRHRIVDWTRGYSLGAVASDRFCVSREPPDAFRLCLGGAASSEQAKTAIAALSDLLSGK